MIVIVGASGKLGSAVAKALLAKGKKVVNLSRTDKTAGVEFVAVDLTDPSSIKQAAAQLNQHEEPLEVLINCAGVFSQQEIEQLTPEQIEQTFATNITGPMLLVSLLMKKIKKDEADIINVASSVGTKAYKSQAAYGASKWAMRGFSANLQVELKDTPCRVISFCPGGFKSKLFKKATGTDNTTSGRWMTAEDLAALIVQLLELPKNMEVSEIIVNRK
jgi:NADP-dependent 3-hydroxy acid dehydrogenase YdfG